MTSDEPPVGGKSSRPKPRRLEVDVHLSENSSSAAVEPGMSSARRARLAEKAEHGQVVQKNTAAKQPGPGYDARMRFEKKGRGGQPVIIIYSLTPQALERSGYGSLEKLARRLREMLGCGGSVVETAGPSSGAHGAGAVSGEVILQVRDRERLEATLAKLGLKVQASGGF